MRCFTTESSRRNLQMKYRSEQIEHPGLTHSCRHIVDDGFTEEVAAYNKELEDLGDPTWFDVPWLFAECYMYKYGFSDDATSTMDFLLRLPT